MLRKVISTYKSSKSEIYSKTLRKLVLLCLFDHFNNTWLSLHAYFIFADHRNRPVEFYDFLRVNTDSNGSEVIDHPRRDDDEVEQKANASVPFIDFLSVGKIVNEHKWLTWSWHTHQSKESLQIHYINSNRLEPSRDVSNASIMLLAHWQTRFMQGNLYLCILMNINKWNE